MKRRQQEHMMVTQPDEIIQFRQLKASTKDGLGGAFDITEELGGGQGTSDKTEDLDEKIY